MAKTLYVFSEEILIMGDIVFEGEITPGLLKSLKRDLGKIIDKTEDSILFYVWYYHSYSRRDFFRSK